MRADDLAKMTVLDDAGKSVVLGTLWKTRAAVLAFVRHFGWLFCREAVVQLHQHEDEIHAAGAELHVIGNGSPIFIEGFRETTHFDGAIYTDPSLAVYKAAGLERGMFKTFNPRSGIKALGALKGGFRQGRTQGDAFQQGGTLVISTAGEILWAHVDHFAGDFAKADEIVRAMTLHHEQLSI